MIRNYFKTIWRDLTNHKVSGLVNITGLAAGMAVALLIGLWIWDELSFDRYHEHYSQLAQVMDNQTVNGEISTGGAIEIPLAAELRNRYADQFKRVALVFPNFIHTVAAGDKRISASGIWAEADLPEMLTLKMINGKRDVLKDPSSVLISQSLATALFGSADPGSAVLRLDNMVEVRVAGVYEDFPQNTSFYGTKLILPWKKALTVLPWLKDMLTKWDTRYWWLYVEMNPSADMNRAGDRIRNIVKTEVKGHNEEIFLHPMSQWHLYSEFRNGAVAGGRIRLVWLFGIIGLSVLLLACINFMNLATARSAKRAREVGIRKTLGSMRAQLVWQFLGGSLLMTFIALLLAMALVLGALPFFNRLAEKQIHIPVEQPVFWLLILGFTVFTGLVSGIYPAFYLSAFRPVTVLKGNFVTGRLASLPRKLLIVLQFTVSLMLIIGVLVIYRQLEYARGRSVGYNRDGLMNVTVSTADLYGAPYDALRNGLLAAGAVADMAKSSTHTTETPYSDADFNWAGKAPNNAVLLGVVGVTHDFGNTIGWKIKEGRDFSRDFATDTGAVILNEAAEKLAGLEHPVGQTIRWNGKEHRIIGVIQDMVMESPYLPVMPAVFMLDYQSATNVLLVRIKPNTPVRAALVKIEQVFKKFDPAGAFDFRFTDEEYAKKFSNEERIGRLAMVFAVLAVFISCLGLYGLASFTAEQRTKEIGVRKVLGASVFSLWWLLLRYFIRLVIISFLIASPAIYYFMHRWLEDYPYRTEIPWWIFALSGSGILLVTLLTVSYQSVTASLTNPVDTLRAQ
jgi:putative ABC transport system permease protein